MSLLNNKFQATVTEDNAQESNIVLEVNYTDDTSQNTHWANITLPKIPDGSAWNQETNNDRSLLSLPTSTSAKYIVVKTPHPILCWTHQPTRDGVTGYINEDPEFTVSNFLVLDGAISELWAVTRDIQDEDTRVTVLYLY